MTKDKIFIIGLPRTATTSMCCAMLELGFKTAHTAYLNQTFIEAEVIADTPVFCDFIPLDKAFPQSKFIYLERDLSLWLPSIKQLLSRMYHNLVRTDGGFNPHIKRCFTHIFPELSLNKLDDESYLTACYQQHQQRVLNYFANREADFLRINVADANSYKTLLKFLTITPVNNANAGFKQINKAGKVTAWNDIKHPLKINSTKKGRIDKQLDYLQP